MAIRESRPCGGRLPDAANVSHSVARAGDEGARPPRRLPCPCGHDPAYDDECVRHRPLGEPLDWSDSAVGYVDQDGPRITSLRQWREVA